MIIGMGKLKKGVQMTNPYKIIDENYPDEIRKQMPLCSYRKYTISEIINAVITTGFTLSQFDEHPAWENKSVPGEFTLVARR